MQDNKNQKENLTIRDYDKFGLLHLGNLTNFPRLTLAGMHFWVMQKGKL
jgi:hypothetical protein